MDVIKKVSFSIYHDLIIKSSLTKVFESVTEPAHLINWWPFKCNGESEVGGVYSFYFSPEYDWFGQVIEYSHNKAFHIKMTKSDSDWNSTTFRFDIEQVNENVQLKFSHVGWPECNNYFRRSSYCWAILLNSLKNYIEKGIVVPFEERE